MSCGPIAVSVLYRPVVSICLGEVPLRFTSSRAARLGCMELATVRFATDCEDAGRLEEVVSRAVESPAIRQAEVVEGFGNGFDIKVWLDRPEGEDEARDAILAALPPDIRLETPPAETIGDAFPG